MIIKTKKHWFQLLFVWNGSVLPKLLPRLLLLFGYAVLITYSKDTLVRYHMELSPVPFTLFGIALALFLGFRNNASYDRFWEGRKLWGALLNDTRSLARQALTLGNTAKAPGTFIQYLIAFTYALKHQLRHTDATADMERLLPPATAALLPGAKYKPIVLMREMGKWVQAAKAAGDIDSIQQAAFDQNFNKLSDIVGGCERIAGTPIPYSYNVLLHRTVYIYCFLLPLGFVDSLGWLMPVVVTFIAYTYVALEAIADELEEPFGTAPNDLALDTMSEMIEHTLLELNDQPLPAKQTVIGDRYYLT
ncbi:bestrophin family protein [Chitinophaga nivalis]|uniref:Bestrophin n=1 Tax=Chitinophaga nivalis TaxID=2991709 RepID=A0ABT3INC2_9BACT|nr:bestrophin family ion channel [Chitinophaga nivalis]MCW3464844.1 hypothetical protein [Chitinophaga nivalis]MCW3485465.1 hypothetical protein [Chitinophaga nivalis]